MASARTESNGGPARGRARFAAAAFPALALAALAAGRLAGAGSPLAVLGAHLVVAVAPGLVAWGLLVPRARPALGVAAALATGPVVALAALLPSLAFASPPTAAVAPSVLAAAAAATLAALRIAPREIADEERGARAALPILLVAVPIVAALPLAAEWWRVRSDAWFHAAFAIEVRDFGVPPQDPFFAGLPLRYFWMFHAMLSALSALSGASPFPFFWLVNAQALVAFVLGVHLLSAAFRRDAISNRLAVLMTLLGLNALFWAFLPLKAAAAFLGTSTGAGELARIFNQFPIDLMRWIHFLSPLDGAQPFFLSKFFVGSAFSVGLALAPLCLLLAVRALRRPSGGEATLGGVAVAGLWAYHPDIGVFLGAAAGGAAVWLVARARGEERARVVGALGPLALAAVAATLVFAPYLTGIGGGAATGSPAFLAPSARRAAAIAASGAAILALAPFALGDLSRRAGPAGLFLLATGLLLAGLALVVRLPGSVNAQTMDKNPYFVALGLAIPAGWALADLTRGIPSAGRRRAAIAWTAGGLLLPANLAMLFGYLFLPRRAEVPLAERELTAWVRSATPRDAVFLESRGIEPHARMRLPVLAPRRVFAGADHLASEWHYPAVEVARRVAIEESLSTGAAPRAIAHLAALGAPLYLVRFVDSSATDAADSAAGNGATCPIDSLTGRPVLFRNERFAVVDLGGAAGARADTASP
jgi:hypothetical protein